VDKREVAEVKEVAKPLLSEKVAKIIVTTLVVLSGVFLVGIVMLLLFNPFVNRMGDLNLNRMFDPTQPVPMEENGMYGFMDTEGNWVIRAQFERVWPFFGEFAMVNLPNSSQIISRSGRVMIETTKNRVTHDPVSDTWLVNGALHNNSLRRVSPTNMEVRGGQNGFFSFLGLGNAPTHGVINARGRTIWTCEGGPCSVDVARRLEGLPVYGAVRLNSGETQIVNLSKPALVTTFSAETSVVALDNNLFSVIDEEGGERQVYIHNNRVAVMGEMGARHYLLDDKGTRLFVDLGDSYDRARFGNRYAYLELPDNWTFLGSPDVWTLDDLLRGYNTFGCGNQVGLRTPRDDVLPCFFNHFEFPAPEIFVWLRQKNGRQIVMTERNDAFALHDIGTGQEVAKSSQPWRNLDDSPFFVSYDADEAILQVYNGVTGEAITLDGVRSGAFKAGANFLSVEFEEGGTRFFNNRLREFFRR